MLIVVALLPAFLGEVHFNAHGYRLNYFRTPERRQLDYLRYLGASVETAKEVKLFGLNGFLIERFRGLPTDYADNRGWPSPGRWGRSSPRSHPGLLRGLCLIVWRTVRASSASAT